MARTTKGSIWWYSVHGSWAPAGEPSLDASGRPLRAREAVAQWDLREAIGVSRSSGEALHAALCRASGIAPPAYATVPAIAERLGLTKQGWQAVKVAWSPTRALDYAKELGLVSVCFADGTWVFCHPSWFEVLQLEGAPAEPKNDDDLPPEAGEEAHPAA